MSTTTSDARRDVGGAPVPGAGRARPSWTRRRLLTVIAAGVLVLVLFATWLVAFSSAFGVHSVQVRGLRSLTAAEVDARANVASGTPLVRVDTAAITAQVESLPEVESAEVSTSFPSTVVITVVERTPVGFVAPSAAGGIFRLLDRTGDAYRAVAARPANLPRLVVSTAPGSAARDARRAVAHVAAALDALPVAMRPPVRSIQALTADAITLVLTHQRVVQWGTASRDADKARVLPIMLRKNAATSFDVADPDRPFST